MTTVRLPKELKNRVAEKLDAAARHADYCDIGERRFENAMSTGKGITWRDMRAYLEARANGEKTKRLVARKFSP